MVSKSRLDDVAKYVELSRDKTHLVWKHRTPDMFSTADPARTAIGWNRTWAGRSIYPNRNGQFSVKRQYFSISTVVKHLGGLNNGARLMQGTKGNTVGDFDDKAIRMIWGVDDDGYVVWKPRTMALVQELKQLSENMLNTRGRAVGSFDEIGMKRFNAVYAGKPVKPRSDGFVYLSGGLRARITEICRAFRIPVKLPDRNLRRRLTPVTDDLIRTLFKIDSTGTLWNRERDAVAWQKIVLEGGKVGVPYQNEIENWNWRHANKPVPVSNEGVVRIGARSVSFNKIYDVLKAQNVGKTPVLDKNPYSF